MLLILVLLVSNFMTVLGILGGYDIDIQKAPYQVNYGDICGGVIIHKKWVLTVAHCGTESYFIRAGSKYRLEAPKVKISNHFVHPLYRWNHSFDYDVQLLELFRELRFRETVKNVKLSDGEIGEFIYVSGWGYSKEKGDSGGAAISYNRLVGVSSFGYGCGRDVPGVYINVSCPNIRRWIRRYTGVQ